MNILFYGDSNTWGFQGDQPQVRLAYEKRFTGIIANRFPQHHIIEEGLPGDLLSQDIREVLHHLGTITGEITTNDILGSIFSRFCVGK